MSIDISIEDAHKLMQALAEGKLASLGIKAISFSEMPNQNESSSNKWTQAERRKKATKRALQIDRDTPPK